MSSSGSGSDSGSDKNDFDLRNIPWWGWGCQLSIWVVAILVVWGGLHYFFGVPAHSKLPFPEPKPILRVSEIKSEIKSESSFDYGKFTVVEWSLNSELVKHPFTGENVEIQTIDGLIVNIAGSNIIVQVNFKIYDEAGYYLGETYAVTRGLNYGETWRFKTNSIDYDDIGSVVFTNISFSYLQ